MSEPKKRGRPPKKAADLTTEEAMAKLFPKRVVKQAKEEAEKASNKATKEDSSG
jgi:hypothetical protein